MKIGKILKDGGSDYILSATKTRETVDLLEQSEEFEKGILYLREKYKIPNEGYPFEKGYFSENLFDDTVLEAIYDDSDTITKKLNLPLYWSGTISFFAIHNIFLTPERLPVEVEHLDFQNDSLTGTHIIIKEKISKAEIHRWIDEAWEDIESAIKSLPVTPKHKMQRSGIAKEIVRLKDEEKKSFKDIAQSLGEKYADNELFDVLNEDYVKTLYHRWKKVLSSKSNT